MVVLMIHCLKIVHLRQNGLKMVFVQTFVVSILFCFFHLNIENFQFCIVGACCGVDESNGCVDDVEFKNCSPTSEWTKDNICDNVCGK